MTQEFEGQVREAIPDFDVPSVAPSDGRESDATEEREGERERES